MVQQNKYPDYSFKVVLASILVISMSLMITTLSENMTNGLMNGIIYSDGFIYTLIRDSLLFGAIPGVISGLIILKYLKPLKLVTKSLFNNEHIDEKSRIFAIKRVSRLNILIIGLSLVIYLLQIIVEMSQSFFPIDKVLIKILYTISAAFIFGTIQTNIINISISRAKSLLNIYKYENGIKRFSLLQKNIGLIIFLTIFVSISFIDASKIITMTNNQYEDIIEQVVKGKLTLDEARAGYKEQSGIMIGVDSNRIIFPYDQEGEPNTSLIFIIYFLQLLIISIIFQYTSTLSQKKQLDNLTKKIEEIANGNGDLTKQVEIGEFNEIGLLTNTINSFINGLRDMLKDVKNLGIDVRSSASVIKDVLTSTEESTQDIVAANEQSAQSTKDQIKIADVTTSNIKEMLKSVNEIADNIESQATSVEQTSSAINEMAANIESVNKTTSTANNLSNNLVVVADRGGNAVNQSITAVKRVEEFSDDIIQMVKLITDISDKTNLLAMNAAIEAAHAGDSGKGFAVVAQEVRKLAEDSAGSAQKISDHIKQMVELVNNGVHLSEGAGDALHTVAVDVKQTNQLIQEVSAAMDEQSAGTREVLDAITNLMNSTQSIRGITKVQQQKNELMNKSIDELTTTFSQIEIAALEQNKGTKKIQDSVAELRKVIIDNDKTTHKLDELLGGFVL